MKVIHVISSLGRGGRERQLSLLCKYSSSFDNQIILFHNQCNDYIDEYNLHSRISVLNAASFSKRLKETYKICKEQKATAIISWGNLESIICLIISPILKIPMINFSIRHGIRKRSIHHLFRSLVLHLSPHVVANSLAGLRANDFRKGIVLYNGINGIYNLELLKQMKQKAKLGLKLGNDIVMVSVANLVPYKDYQTVLRALKIVREKGYTFYYYIVGEGPNRPGIEKTIRENGLSDYIYLTGSIKNVDDYLLAADIMIHSSRGEGCSNAILEGMKYALPIIATDVGGVPEIVSKDNALLFQYGCASELSKYIMQLFDNHDQRIQMGENSFMQIESRFAIEVMIKRFEYIVSAIIHNNKSSLKSLMQYT